jgi:hypothetical protein
VSQVRQVSQVLKELKVEMRVRLVIQEHKEHKVLKEPIQVLKVI